LADISKINAVALANIAKLDAVLAANIAKVNGLVFTTAGISAPAAAYSVRLLDSALGVPTYTGAAMRVRRDTAGGAGDDDEADIAFDSGIISLDSAISNASAGVTATTLGQFLNVGTVGGTTYTNPDSLTVTASCYVDTWYDQSGNANDAEQATETSQPQIHDGTVNTDLITENGKPAIEWDGSSTYLATADFTAESQPFYFSLVAAPDSTILSRFIDTNGTIADNRVNITQANSSTYEINAGNSLLGGTTTATQQLLTADFDTTNSFLYNNGAQIISGDAGTRNIDSIRIGANKNGIQVLDGTFQEVVFYNSDQSDNRTAIETNINSEYLIYQPTDAPTSGLLATYTGAAAAYSVRQLSDKAILSMRVRRDSDDVEQNFGFDTNGDLDTAGIASFCGTANGYVTRWWDQSTNGNHADQATDTSQPQIYNGTAVITENGKPAIEFDGHKLGHYDLAVSQPYTFNFVGRYAGSTAVGFAPFFGSGGDLATTFVSFLVRSNNFQMQAPSLANVTTADTNQHNFFLLYDGSSSLWAFDGGTTTTINPGTAAIENFAVGARGADSGVTELRYFQELVLWPSDQDSAGNRTGIEENINSDFLIYQPTDTPTSGLLATYTGAAAAYSVRQLSDKAVIAMRIRRDSDDEETNIGWDTNGDLATADIAAFCGTANGYVTRWWDQSTNGNHADQATDTSQPQIYNGTAVITENGKPAIYHNDQTLVVSSFTGGASSGTIVGVLANIENTGIPWLSNGTGGPFFLRTNQGQFADSAFRALGTVTAHINNVTDTDYQQGDSWNDFNSSQGLMFLDCDTSATTNANFNICHQRDVHWQELIFWDSDQDGAGNRTGIQNNVNTYFSIY